MIAIELSKRSPGLIFAAATALTTGFPLSVSALGRSNLFSISAIQGAIIFVIIFNIIFVLMRMMSPYRPISPILLITYRNTGTDLYLKYMSTLFFLTFILFIAGAGFNFSIITNRTWRDSGDFDYIVGYLANISFGIVLVMFFINRRTYALICMLAVIILVFLDRSRSLILPAIMPLILYFSIKSLDRGYRVLKMSGTILVIMSILLLHGLVQQVRYRGTLANVASSDVSTLVSNSIEKMMQMEGEFGLYRYMLWAFEGVQRIDGSGGFRTLIRMLSFWLPSSFKPVDTTHAIAAAYGAIAGTSYHPTVYGLAYVDGGGFLGVYYAPFLALIFIFIDAILEKYRRKWYLVSLFLLAPACTFAALTARGTMSNAWVILCVCSTIIIGIWYITRFRIGNINMYRKV